MTFPHRTVTVSALVFAAFLSASTPAFASDYTLDCQATQGAPWVDYDGSAAWYGYQDIEFDGTTDVTVTVTIQNCGYHYAVDSTGYTENPYVGTSTVAEYTLTIPVDGSGDVRGYNTWDSPTSTSFGYRFTNPAPAGGSGSGGGGGGGGGGGHSHGSSSDSALASTGVTENIGGGVLVGITAAIVGLGLTLRARRRLTD